MIKKWVCEDLTSYLIKKNCLFINTCKRVKATEMKKESTNLTTLTVGTFLPNSHLNDIDDQLATESIFN